MGRGPVARRWSWSKASGSSGRASNPRGETPQVLTLLQPFGLDGAPVAPGGGATPAGALVGEVAFTVQEGAVALAALYGEVHVNPAGTAFDRVIANLQWGAYTR